MTALRFSAVVGQERAKRALLLAAVRPSLGGVLLRGDKGSGKTTLARGLAALLPGEAPFVELPLGATEERVIGSLDLAELLVNGHPRFRPGLLAAAHGGVLYVDEINLLADHLVDTLLDVAASGVNRVERDGLSHTHPARFVLVASMNPEEGELRPQLLDRFGLSVDVTATGDVTQRALAVRRQLDVETGHGESARFDHDDATLRATVAAAVGHRTVVPDDIVRMASLVAVDVGAEGLRADLMLARAASAAAAFDGRDEPTVDDLRSVAEMVLAHRRRRRPFDEPGIDPDEVDDAFDRAEAPSTAADDEGGGSTHDEPESTLAASIKPTARPSRRAGADAGRFAPSAAPRGRHLREQPYQPDGATVDGRATAVALATRRAEQSDPSASLVPADLRAVEREQRTGSLVVFAVDASASMGLDHRMALTKAAVIGLLGDAYRRRGRVALVTFHGDGAEVVLRPTASVEIAKARLEDVRTGGTTPLAAGLDAAQRLVVGSTGDRLLQCTVVVVTDGRATAGGSDPVAASMTALERLAATGAELVVVDTEGQGPRLGLARDMAAHVGAQYVRLDQLGDEGLAQFGRPG